jgi:hexosaminidase
MVGKMKILNHLKIFMAVMLAACSLTIVAQSPIAVRGELLNCNNPVGYYNYRFTIKNVGHAALAGNWQFYFTQFPREVRLVAQPALKLEEVNPGYYCLSPTAAYKSLASGDTLVANVMMRGQFVGISYQPEGAHVVLNGDMKHPIAVTIDYGELSNLNQWEKRDDYRDGNFVYNFNKGLNPNGVTYKASPYDIFPTPKKITNLAGTTAIPAAVKVIGLPKAKAYLTAKLRELGVTVSENANSEIMVMINPKMKVNDEYYELHVGDGRISIKAQSEQGAINGATTLVSAIIHNGGVKKPLPNVAISDYPDFHYRGFMIDIARNFTTYDNLKKLLDLLSSYKINKLQFHFTDDEGWRLEIPGLPELTAVGSRRGCTRDEKDFLAQCFTGNGNPDDLSNSANGYITRAQFIEFLKYAVARGIKVIPEVETPGHARAAIVAMKARYNKYIGTDAARAQEFVMWDDADTSKFTSAQGFHDNVMNIAQEGVFNFVKKVVVELKKMYLAAGQPFDVIHLGGDEVPAGSWDNSPAVQQMMRDKGLKSNHEVSQYYMRRITDWLYPQGIKVEGWQEVALKHSPEYNAEMAKRFAGVNAWSTLGRADSVPYTLANNGYPVILSNVNNFYFDLSYTTHQYEPGLRWGGVADEFCSWYAQPWNIYRTARTDYNGKPIDLRTVADGKPALQQRDNIIGCQGQLWGETIRNFDMVQTYILPKMLGMVERSWNSTPSWADKLDDDADFINSRALYNLKIGESELPALKREGWIFHVGQPGIVVENGKLLANAQYPGEVVRYTVDGSEPDGSSPVWTAPVDVPSVPLIKAKAFYLGHSSVTTYLFGK